MLALSAQSLAFTGMQPVRPMTVRMSETAAGLEELAKKCNPTIGFYDPLGLVEQAKENGSEEATLGWLRHACVSRNRTYELVTHAIVSLTLHDRSLPLLWQ